MSWKNMIWSCGICNQWKGNRFPSSSEPAILDPVLDDVWQFFFIDRFGNLSPRWRVELNALDPRAEITRDLLRLDRQPLQESRRFRFSELVVQVSDTLARFATGEVSREEIADRRAQWLKAPLQPDVADYFFNGPGRNESPFKELHAVLDASSP
jgi:hypothetical protein